MPKSTRQCLRETLGDLKKKELKNFKTNLNEFPVKPGYKNISRGDLEEADVLDLTDQLVGHYNEDYAVEVAIEVLRLSDCNRQAEKLAALCGIGNQPSSQLSSSPDQHFIDRFREQLIQRTNTLDQVLDKLHGSILNEEQYQKIRSKTMEQEKMRELYKLVHGWDRKGKDKLYNALKDTDPFLIESLEEDEATRKMKN